MKQIHTAVLERFGTFSGDFATEPYEAGWAEEAIFFVRMDAVEGAEPALTGRSRSRRTASRGSTRAPRCPPSGRRASCSRASAISATGSAWRAGSPAGRRRFRGMIYLCLKG